MTRSPSDSVEIRVGDALEVLGTLGSESVHAVVTSPPYWGLRDYGVEGQIGLEATIEEHVERLVEVFREVRRVLRSDGTLWFNYGDGYASAPGGRQGKNGCLADRRVAGVRLGLDKRVEGLKSKDLIGMPWRLALALQADGWWLRADCIWHKPNALPSSARDRPTLAHEYLFLLAKSPNYFYDLDAVRMAARNVDPKRPSRDRNLRTVWTVPTAPFPGAHFATFPCRLVEPCIRASTSEKGCCRECGAPWRRVVQVEGPRLGQSWHDHSDDLGAGQRSAVLGEYRRETVGWESGCECNWVRRPALFPAQPMTQEDLVPAVVLDPFAGAGTTGLVAAELGRRALLIELNPDYAAMARERIGTVVPLAPRT